MVTFDYMWDLICIIHCVIVIFKRKEIAEMNIQVCSYYFQPNRRATNVDK